MEKPYKKVKHINCPNLPTITRTVITKPPNDEIIGGYQPIKLHDGSYALWCYWDSKVVPEDEIADYIAKVVPEYIKNLKRINDE